MIKRIFMANLDVFLIGVAVCFTGLVLSPSDGISRRWKCCMAIALSGLTVVILSAFIPD